MVGWWCYDARVISDSASRSGGERSMGRTSSTFSAVSGDGYLSVCFPSVHPLAFPQWEGFAGR